MVDCGNSEVIEHITEIQKDPDTDYGYRKMTVQLILLGLLIHHKEIYRLMQAAQFLKARYKGSEREFAKFRNVNPTAPLEVLEINIIVYMRPLLTCGP